VIQMNNVNAPAAPAAQPKQEESKAPQHDMAL